MADLKIALAGNPNAGKSSIFNHLTGLRQKTANFPGVTVEKKTGHSEIEGLSRITVEREWRVARLWLTRELKGATP